MSNLINLDSLSGIIEDVQVRSANVPFGNSDFQNINIVAASMLLPARAQRAALLRLNDRINSLRESYYLLKKEELDLELLSLDLNELEESLVSNNDLSAIDKRRIEIRIEQKKIDIEQKMSGRPMLQKLISDAMAEVDGMYQYIQKMPVLARSDFEAEEHAFFELKSRRQLDGMSGPAEMLENIIRDKANLDKLIEQNALVFNALIPETTQNRETAISA